MNPCDLDVVLYFYDEMDDVDRARAAVHLRGCETCRQRLEELHAIRGALAARPLVEAPAAGDWSGFMRRLDAAVQASRSAVAPTNVESPSRIAHTTLRRRIPGGRQILALAAMLTLVVTGVFMAARFRAAAPFAPAVTAPAAVAAAQPSAQGVPGADVQSLREVSAEHFERSKLVVLGLTARDPEQTTVDDWQYERRLAATLLSDTRLYRIAAQDRGVSDVAGVMRDLETVLLEASLSDSSDGDALERVQRLIAKRDLVMKMQLIATGDSAGT